MIRERAHNGLPGLPMLLLTIALGWLVFVLARIFRHGAQMRADLEGTV